MQQVYVRFRDVDQVTRFINTVSRMEPAFDLGTGNNVVNAKSLIGVFTLDLSQPQLLRFNSDDRKIYEELEPFLEG
ncbi:MAG: HPr family phosphocarrier protein [Ruminococcus sp.]|nr:HPr family phosphocarrier protein [Ruminococcus sp.]